MANFFCDILMGQAPHINLNDMHNIVFKLFKHRQNIDLVIVGYKFILLYVYWFYL